MPISSTIHQPDQLPFATRNQHIEALPETELPHNIVREIPEPIAHIPDHSLGLAHHGIPAGMLPREDRTQLPHMQQHNVLHALERIVRERLAQHAPLAAVNGLIDRIVGVIHALDGREGVVEIRLLEPLPVSVDIMQTLVGVDGDEIRGYPNMRPVLGMQSV